MKKFFLFFFLGFVAAIVVNSQSLQLADSTGPISNNADIFKHGSADAEEIVSHIFVKNSTGNAISVLVKKVELVTLGNTMNALCWGVCFPPDIYVATDPIEIGAGLTDSLNFSGHYYPQGVSGITTIRYVFFDERNPSDSVCVNVSYSTFPLAVIDPASVADVVAYPNPANQSVNFDLPAGSSSESRLLVRNLLGNVVMDVPASPGRMTLNTGGLASGVYLYTLIENGKPVSSRKLVIRH